MRIALDVMGGDHGCGVVLEGAKQALQNLTAITTLFLVGQRDQILAGFPEAASHPRVQVVPAAEVLEMTDKPVAALRRKKDCSVRVAADLVRDSKADAIVSLGNTGGIFAAATFRVGRIAGVDRGAIATVMPTGQSAFVLLDAGANVECKPYHLAQFAVMGNVYSREILGCAQPRVGVLSIGTEKSKGNPLSLAAWALCKQLDLNFIGNVEGHDLFHDRVDVVVCDGFVGNIVLKTSESLATAMFDLLKRELMANPLRQAGAWLAQSAYRSIKKRLDPEGYGGAPLLGFNGVVLKAHASATARAVASAIRVATENVRHDVSHIIAREIAAARKKIGEGEPESVSATEARES